MTTKERDTQFFQVDLQTATLKERSIRGGILTLSCQAIDSFLKIASVAILARLLIPEYFGLISMVIAVTAIAERVKDFGLSTATVQQKNITHDQVSQLFWINAAIGLGLTVLISSGSFLIARLFREPRLTYVAIVISSGFLWSGLAIQHQAILQRQLRYVSLGGIQVASTAISLAIAIMLAIAGYGYWSLVCRELARNVFIALATWICCPWIPGPPTKHINIDRLIKFGRDITGFNVVVFAMASLDQILIGRLFGAAQLGIYRQAQQLISSFNTQLIFPLTRVVEPSLSFLQDDARRYSKYYQKMLSTLSVVMMPLLGFLVIYSREVVFVVLGEDWRAATEFLRIFALAAFVGHASDTTGSLLVTCGQTKRYFKLGLATGVIALFSFGIGALWGALGVAYGYLAGTYLLLLVRLHYGLEGTPVNARAFFKAIEKPLVASLVMMILLLVFNTIVVIHNDFALLSVALPISLVTYVLVLMTIPGGKEKVREIVSDVMTSLRVGRSIVRMSAR